MKLIIRNCSKQNYFYWPGITVVWVEKIVLWNLEMTFVIKIVSEYSVYLLKLRSFQLNDFKILLRCAWWREGEWMQSNSEIVCWISISFIWKIIFGSRRLRSSLNCWSRSSVANKLGFWVTAKICLPTFCSQLCLLHCPAFVVILGVKLPKESLVFLKRWMI